MSTSAQFRWLWGRIIAVGSDSGQRKPTTAENEHECSISAIVGGGGGSQRRPTTAGNEQERSISAVVGEG